MLYESKIIYGPVDSRRLGKWKNETLIECGKSLGINLTKIPACSFDCIYCSCGKTEELTLNPSSYYSLEEIKIGLKKGFKKCIEKQVRIDYISFVGWTEPTLHPYFDEVVDLFYEIKQRYFPDIPTAIFTNSTTLNREIVRKSLVKFNRTFFKLDAASEKVFRAVNRPANGIKLETIIENLAAFSKESGKVELSCMVTKTNYRDLMSENYVKSLDKIKPRDRIIYLCTPDWLRPTGNSKGVSLMPKKEILEKVKDYLQSFNYRAIILPPKRKGLHPLVRK